MVVGDLCGLGDEVSSYVVEVVGPNTSIQLLSTRVSMQTPTTWSVVQSVSDTLTVVVHSRELMPMCVRLQLHRAAFLWIGADESMADTDLARDRTAEVVVTWCGHRRCGQYLHWYISFEFVRKDCVAA